VLRISSRNYSSWSLRGWLILRLSGLPFETELVSPDDPATRAELLLQSSSILLPCLLHDGVELWDTLAIAEYLNEPRPEARLMPEERVARARCRSISGEMHAGFHALRSSLPMNLRAHVPGFTVWSAAAGGSRAHLRPLARLPRLLGRALALRRPADAGGCDVRPGRAALPQLRRGTRRLLRGLCPDDPRLAGVEEWIAAARQEPEARITELEYDAEF
jgi:glutathione S-transferase